MREGATNAELVARLDELLGLDRDCAAVFVSGLSGPQAERLRSAAEKLCDCALTIAAKPWWDRRSLQKWWLEIQKVACEGRIDQSLNVLESFAEEIRVSSYHDPAYSLRTEILLTPLVLIVQALFFALSMPIALATGLRGAAWPKAGHTPLLGEMLLFLFLNADERTYVLGDLEEELRTTVTPRFGRAYAIGWYWSQVLGTLVDRTIGRWLNWGGAACSRFLAELIAALLK
jgi:hypothetical protein